MCISARIATAAVALLATISFAPWAWATDLNGAWAADSSVCSKVFVKGGNKISFTPDAELYGAGLLIEGNQATGSFQKCRIKSTRADGDILHVVAACSTGIMVSDTQATVKVVDNNHITLTVVGPGEIGFPLIRCSM